MTDSTAKTDDASSPSTYEQPREQGCRVLDFQTAERQYYREGGILREVWRPGDSDGDQGTDYWERPEGPPPFEQRWRFYQSPIMHGPLKAGKNEPPRFVLLDDRAAYEVLTSNIPKTHLLKHWPHDFCSPGKIRPKRLHRGRPAIGDETATDGTQYQFTNAGTIDIPRYYFTGAPDWTPIVYTNIPTTVPSTGTSNHLTKRKASPSSEPSGTPKSKRVSRSHNQHTPKDLLVKHGAPSSAKDGRPKRNGILLPRPQPGSVAPSYGQAYNAVVTRPYEQPGAQVYQSLEHDRLGGTSGTAVVTKTDDEENGSSEQPAILSLGIPLPPMRYAQSVRALAKAKKAEEEKQEEKRENKQAETESEGEDREEEN